MNKRVVLVILILLALVLGIVAAVIANQLEPKVPFDKNSPGIQETMQAACENGGESCPEPAGG